MTDDYRDWDAAYLLGSLSSAERREFEDHLAGCADCSAALGELAALPGLLSKVPAAQFETAEGEPAVPFEPARLPASILPRLVAAARRRRVRVRALTAGLVAAAAAVAVVLTLVVPQLMPAPAGNQVSELTLRQVVPSPLSADIRLVAHEWGTSVDMRCRYTAGGGYGEPGAAYALYVTDTSGNETQLATWTVRPGGTVEPSGTTSLALDEIRSVEVRAVGSGEVLLAGSR